MARYNRQPKALHQKGKVVDMDKHQFKTMLEIEKRKLKVMEASSECYVLLSNRIHILNTILNKPEPEAPKSKLVLYWGAQALESAACICIVVITLKFFRVI